MAKGFKIGINNLAQKGGGIWVGVDGIARKVKKAFVGVNGIAEKWWPSNPVFEDNGDGFRMYLYCPSGYSGTTSQNGNRDMAWSGSGATRTNFTAIGNQDLSKIPRGAWSSYRAGAGAYKYSDGTALPGVVGPLPPAVVKVYGSIWSVRDPNEHFGQLYIRGESGTYYYNIYYSGSGSTVSKTATLTINEPHYCALQIWCDDGWANENKTSDFQYTVVDNSL